MRIFILFHTTYYILIIKKNISDILAYIFFIVTIKNTIQLLWCKKIIKQSLIENNWTEKYSILIFA